MGRKLVSLHLKSRCEAPQQQQASSRSRTKHHVIFGNCQDMHEIASETISLTVTSPPYYNAPFDYPGMYKDYDEYLKMLSRVCDEMYRVTAPGRIVCLVIDDMLVDGEKLPIVADATTLMRQTGFRYRDKIIWVKPKGYSRISRRSGVLVQHPYPMYFYPDNIQESVLIFQKGRYDYKLVKEIDPKVLQDSKIDSHAFNEKGWNLTVWHITNVLPTNNVLEKGIAAYPEELASRIIQLFSFKGETVLDPFTGSGTTAKCAGLLGRDSVGYELLYALKPKIHAKVSQSGGVITFERRIDSVTPELIIEETNSKRSVLPARKAGGQSMR